MMAVAAALLAGIAIFGFSYCLLDQLAGESAQSRRLMRSRAHALKGPLSAPAIEKAYRLSEIEAFNRFLKKQRTAPAINRALEMAGWKISAGFFILISLMAAALLYCFLMLTGLSFWCAAALSGAAAVFGPAALLSFKRRQYLDQFTEHFPKALQIIRAALSAGLGLSVSFERVAKDSPYPVNLEFSKMMDEMALGKNFSECLLDLKNRVPLNAVKTFVVAISVQRESGGNLAELIRNLEETLYAAGTLRKEMRVLCTQARLSGWIIGALPIFLAVAIKIINPRYYGVLTETEGGRQLVLATVVLQVLGFLTIKKFVTFKIVT